MLLCRASCYMNKIVLELRSLNLSPYICGSVLLRTWLFWILKLNMSLSCTTYFRDKFIFGTMVDLQEECSCHRGSYKKDGRKDKVSIQCYHMSYVCDNMKIYDFRMIFDHPSVKMWWCGNFWVHMCRMLIFVSILLVCWLFTNCELYDILCCSLVGEISVFFWIFADFFGWKENMLLGIWLCI